MEKKQLSSQKSKGAKLIVSLICVLLSIIYFFWSDIQQQFEKGNKIKVFILAGQSNMEGRADGNKLSQEDLARLSKAQENVQLAFNQEPMIPLNVVKPSPEIAKIYKRDLIFGPELFFGISLSEVWLDQKILLIKLAEGGTSLHGCWNADWNEENAKIMGEENEPKLYQALIDYIESTLSKYENDEYEISAILWVQGESDSGNDTAAEAYGENLKQFIISIREELKNDSLPFILFQVGRGEVVEGMKRTAELLPNVTLIPQSTDETSPDFYAKMKNGHYNYDGMKKLGSRFADVIIKELEVVK